MVPASWMPSVKMTRVHIHWTAGAHKASAFDKQHYHMLTEADGKLVRGIPVIGGRIAHTLNANSGAIGISMCCMGDTQVPSRVREVPFVPGPFPMTKAQWDATVLAVADLCRQYKIPVTPKTVLTHAEVQPNLGIKQRGKWDITRIAFDLKVIGYKAVGDKFRKEVALALDGEVAEEKPVETTDLPRFKVVGVKPSTLTWRDGPNGNKIGSVPEGTVLEKLGPVKGDWWQMRTKLLFVGWVSSDFLVAA